MAAAVPHPPPATGSYEADLAQVRDIFLRRATGEPVSAEEHAESLRWLRVLAPVLDENDDIDPLKLGDVDRRRRDGRPLTHDQNAAWELLAKNGGGWTLKCAARAYDDHNIEKLYRRTRHTGGTITTERHEWRDGQHTVTRAVERFPAPTHRPCSRVASRSRERRAAPARRTSSSSTTSGSDPGGSDSSDPPPPPEPKLWRHPRHGLGSPNLLRLLVDVADGGAR
jgi:hypothetical protein